MKKTSTYRYLRGYTLDPAFSTQLETFDINQTLYRIRWEEDLLPGPVGEYFEVVDYDPASQCFYDPVDLNSIPVLSQGGLIPSEGNPQFHQQFVYTIAMRTLEYFEKALGRKIIWHHREMVDDKGEVSYAYVDRLRIYPHALREANAYYQPDKRALLFGYFKAGATINDINYPGGVVFTCLAPDIVAHEVTHAILESIHPHFGENTNPDVSAFHEAFADLIALLQRFMLPEFLTHQLTQSGGKLDEFTLLGELATQFGQAMDRGEGALRSAIGRFNEETRRWEKITPNPKEYREKFEPHDRGAILVATVFDTFVRLYNHKTRDLFRIGGDKAPSPDLIGRLAREAADIARHLLQICIQALDYCPPFDITFGDYLRALVTADLDLAPSDEEGYRVALIEAFRARGIFPDRVNTLSVESLCWSQPADFSQKDKDLLAGLGDYLKKDIRSLLDMKDRKKIYDAAMELRQKLLSTIRGEEGSLYTNYSTEDRIGFLSKLGMAAEAFTLEYDGIRYEIGGTGNDAKSNVPSPVRHVEIPPILIHDVRPIYRYSREGRLEEQVIVTLSQHLHIERPGQSPINFRGGCTMVFRMADSYVVDYVISKNVMSNRRFQAQLDYQSGKLTPEMAISDTMYLSDAQTDQLNFKLLHQ